MSGKWVVAAPFGAVAGVLVGEHLGPGPGTGLLLGAGMAAVVAWWWRPVSGGVALVALALVAAALSVRAADGLRGSAVAAAARRATEVSADVTLVTDPSPRRWSTTALARVERFSWSGAVRLGHRQVLLVATRPASSELVVPEAGDRLRVQGTLEPLAGPERRWRWRHVVARLRVESVEALERSRSPLFRVAAALRHTVATGLEPMAPRERGLLTGFLFGGTRGVPDDAVADFRRAGLAHLLAVSGSNVAFVLALVRPVLLRFELRGRFAAGLLVLATFAAATRFEPSVLRAVAMAAIAMAGDFAGRPVKGLPLLLAAATALVLADPFLVHSVGFRLSCAACAGIVVLGPRLRARMPGPPALADALGTTAAAQIGVAPVLLPVFGSIPLIALPANLAAMPAAGPLTTAGMLAGVVGGLVHGVAPELSALLVLPASIGVRYVEAVAALAARMSIPIHSRGALVVLGLVASVAAVRHGSRRLDDRVGRPPLS